MFIPTSSRGYYKLSIAGSTAYFQRPAMEAARRPGQEPLGPAPEPPAIHPSFIQVARPYMFEQTIQDCVQAMGMNPMREEGVRLQGVSYIDNVRKVLHLYVPSYQILRTKQREGHFQEG